MKFPRQFGFEAHSVAKDTDFEQVLRTIKLQALLPKAQCRHILDADCSLKRCAVGKGHDSLATTDSFFTKWSAGAGFLHGADMMVSVGSFVEKLLEKDEKVTGIEDLRFNQAMQSNLFLVASDKKIDRPPEIKNYTLEATFVAQKEQGERRKIFLVGAPNGDPVLQVSAYNRLADESMNRDNERYSFGPTVHQHRYAVSTPPVMQVLEEKNRTGLHISTVFDQINIIALHLKKLGVLRPDKLFLHAGVHNLTLPPIESLVREQLAITLSLERNKQKQTERCVLIPATVQYVKNDGTPVGGGTFTIAADEK